MSDAEIALWIAVAETVRPSTGARVPERRTPPPPPAAPTPTAPPRDASTPFLPPYVPQPPPRRGTPPLAPFEKRLRQKIVRGRFEIEAALDLHGMAQPEAHAALRGFLRGEAARGARLVLVVTGKGRLRPDGASEAGVLRRAVPNWLRADDLRPVVMGFEEAAQPHGGLGALYVRLRRREG